MRRAVFVAEEAVLAVERSGRVVVVAQWGMQMARSEDEVNLLSEGETHSLAESARGNSLTVLAFVAVVPAVGRWEGEALEVEVALTALGWESRQAAGPHPLPPKRSPDRGTSRNLSGLLRRHP